VQWGDDEAPDPEWLRTRLVDAPGDGRVREEVRALAQRVGRHPFLAR
jgi:hypothetical protein